MPRQGPLNKWMEHSKLELAKYVLEGGIKNMYISTETHDIFFKVYKNTKTEDNAHFDGGHFINFIFKECSVHIFRGPLPRIQG